MFDPLWRQRWNKFRRLLVENLGVRHTRDVASWTVAFGVAYWLWVRPARKERADNEVSTETLTQPTTVSSLDGARVGATQSTAAQTGRLMVLGFDNTGLLIAVAFAAVVLTPKQLSTLGRQCGRTVGWAVGHLAEFQKEIARSGGKSEIAKIQREVQETMSTLNAIQHEIRRGTRIIPQDAQKPLPLEQSKSETVEPSVVKPLPVSAASVGMLPKRDAKGVRFGSEIVLQSILEEEVAKKAERFVRTGDIEER